MLHTTSLEYSYPGEAAFKFPDIACERGEQWLILGASGGGKTTLLHLLAGLRKPSSGNVQIKGTDLAGLSVGALDKFRGKNLGMIFQQSHFLRALTVRENVRLAQQLAGVPINDKAITSILDRLNVGHKLHALPTALSMGEQQRVAIARAVINNPAVILADEPTSALDDTNTGSVIDLLREQASQVDATLIIVTHDNRLKEQFENRIEL